MQVISQALPWLYAVVGVVFLWLVIELALTVRRTRSSLKNMESKVDQVVKDVDEISTEILPAIQKVDPLMDRLSLTVDAANLEIMRLDEILEDVSTMTSVASKATKQIETVTNAPLELVNSVADKVRRRFGPKTASKKAMQAGKVNTESKNALTEDPVEKLVDSVDEAFSFND